MDSKTIKQEYIDSVLSGTLPPCPDCGLDENVDFEVWEGGLLGLCHLCAITWWQSENEQVLIKARGGIMEHKITISTESGESSLFSSDDSKSVIVQLHNILFQRMRDGYFVTSLRFTPTWFVYDNKNDKLSLIETIRVEVEEVE